MSVYVSTGHLPAAARVQALLDDALARFAGRDDGAVSDVYPALAAADPRRFGIALVSTGGAAFTAGDAQAGFPIMSVAKPFVFAAVCDRLGPDAARDAIGVDATGLPFNSLTAIERSPDGRTNPMVNAGAIATTSLVPGDDLEDRWAAIVAALSGFAGHDLALDEEVLASALATNGRNRVLARELHRRGRLGCDPETALVLYTRQSCVRVDARTLATMGATLADGGVNPVTGRRVVAEATCRYTLATMVTAGLYELSGSWLYDVGLPAKSGIGGGIVTVSPGKGGMATLAPRLDAAGNSVQGTLVARHLARELGLDLLASQPAP